MLFLCTQLSSLVLDSSRYFADSPYRLHPVLIVSVDNSPLFPQNMLVIDLFTPHFPCFSAHDLIDLYTTNPNMAAPATVSFVPPAILIKTSIRR